MAKQKKIHPADQADRNAVAKAKYFTAFLRRSPTSKILERRDTLREAVAVADEIKGAHPGRNVLVYAISARDNSTPVPQDMQDAARAGEFDVVPKAAKAKSEKVVTVDSPEFANSPEAKANAASWENIPDRGNKDGSAKAPKAARVSKRGEIEADAKAGKLPPAPDFSADTHKPYRKRLAEMVAMVEAGDLKGLRKLEIKTYSSSPKALARYRDLAVMALTARRAGGGSPGEGAAIFAEEAGIPYSEALVACNMD